MTEQEKFQSRITSMTTEALKALEEKIRLTINNAPMLADDQRATLTASWEAVLKELNRRVTQFFVDAARHYPPGSEVISEEGHTGTVITKVDFDSILVEWHTA